MKEKLIIPFVCLALALPGIGAAAETLDPWASWYMPGNVSFGVSAGMFDKSLPGFIPSVEVILKKARLARVIPVDVGLHASGAFSALHDDGTGLRSAGGAGASFHMGFRNFSSGFSQYLENIDIYTSFLVGTISKQEPGRAASTSVSGAFHSGIGYFLGDHFAVTAGNFSWFGEQSALFVGVRYRTGPKEPVVGKSKAEIIDLFGSKPQAMNEDQAGAALGSLQAGYWTYFSLGGFIFPDDDFEPGDGTEWMVSVFDPESSRFEGMSILKALVDRGARGEETWKYVLSADGVTRTYELVVNAEGKLEQLFTRIGTEIRSFTPVAPLDWVPGIPVSDGERATYLRDHESLTVAAGTFPSSRMQYGVPRATEYSWWTSTEVPGELIRFQGVSNYEVFIRGELAAITRDNRSELANRRPSAILPK